MEAETSRSNIFCQILELTEGWSSECLRHGSIGRLIAWVDLGAGASVKSQQSTRYSGGDMRRKQECGEGGVFSQIWDVRCSLCAALVRVQHE